MSLELSVENLARVHDALGIHGVLDRLHDGDPGGAELRLQLPSLAHADPVLPGARAAAGYGPVRQLGGGLLARLVLVRTLRVEEEGAVKVAVSDVSEYRA